MSKHTPGPWTVEPSPPGDRTLSIVSQTAAVTVAYVPCLVDPARFGGSPAYVDQQYADAALIAAAPGMLAALRLAQSAFATYAATGAFTAGQPSAWLLSQLSSAIARAEGAKQ